MCWVMLSVGLLLIDFLPASTFPFFLASPPHLPTSSSLLILPFSGPIVLAPLSELYGRMPLYHASNIGFILFTIACALATNLNMLIGFRFLEGLFGSCPVTIGGGTIADMFVQEKRGGVMAIWALGPLMGEFVALD